MTQLSAGCQTADSTEGNRLHSYDKRHHNVFPKFSNNIRVDTQNAFTDSRGSSDDDSDDSSINVSSALSSGDGYDLNSARMKHTVTSPNSPLAFATGKVHLPLRTSSQNKHVKVNKRQNEYDQVDVDCKITTAWQSKKITSAKRIMQLIESRRTDSLAGAKQKLHDSADSLGPMLIKMLTVSPLQ